MQLIYNPESKAYEFQCGREERNKTGQLGLALASSARFTPRWKGREPLYVTTDPYKAIQLAAYATPELQQQIRDQIAEKGGGIPVLTYRDGVYIWSGPPVGADGTNYHAIPQRAGMAFTRTPYMSMPRGVGSGMDEPVWWTESSLKASKCAEYADEAARLAIGEYLTKRHKALESSRAQDAEIDIPVPEGLTPFGYQRAGVAYAKPRNRVLFGDEMGLGKTIEAILWANLIAEELGRNISILVICPASLKRNWMREMTRWLYRPAVIGIADSGYAQVVPPTDIVIINYDILSRRVDTGRTKTVGGKKRKVFDYFLRDSLKRRWDLLIVDECHRLKGDPKQVVRARMVFSIQADRMAFLSGTPMVNRPRELWNIAHHLAPKAFPDKAVFLERYCKGGGFMTPYDGARNLGELQEKLRLWIMVRRLKRDVLKDLPPKLRQVLELPASGCESLVKNELLAFSRKEDVLTTMRLKVELSKASENVEDYKQAVARLTTGIKVAFEELSRIRRETAVAKIPVVTDHVASILAEDHKVILFCHHKEVAYTIAETMEAHLKTGQKLNQTGRAPARLERQFEWNEGRTDVSEATKPRKYSFSGERVAVCTGDTSIKDRDLAVTLFQEDDKCRLFIGTIGAAGVGLTLTASSYVVFAELDWVPGNVTQAEDRAHRIGQAESVLIQHLVLEGSLDKRMADVLVEKQDVADRALDREAADELLIDPVTPDREKVATQGVSHKEIGKIAGQLEPDDIKAVHYGLKLLAGKHKDAHLIDGLTFREVDAPLGKILAEMRQLSPRQAALGKKFLAVYRNTQLGMMPEIQKLFTKEKA